MRKNLHRILSGIPALALALVGLWATVSPMNALLFYRRVQFILIADSRILSAAVLFLILYAALWWITSLETPTRRQLTQTGLQPHYAALSGLQQQMQQVDSPDALLVLKRALEAALNEAGGWIDENMVPGASAKFQAPSMLASFWPWPGQSQPDTELRGNMLSLNQARLRVLDEFLQHGGWDKP